MINSRKLLIIITGPTAVGKTSFSIELAKLLHTEIISADSRQFYREMKIGTASLSLQELNDIKHHFIGHLSVHDYYNVSKYESDAVNRINELFRTYDKLIMVGGSGLYINAVIHGIDDLPDPDETTRNYFKSLYANEGIESLRKLLWKSDPEYYAQVDLKNPSRLIRALEVCFTTGKKYSQLRKNEIKQRNFRHIIIGLNRQRDELFEIINRRTDKMIEHGLVEEAAGLYSLRTLNALNTVGYKEIFEYFDGIITLEQAIENIKTNTRRYAKRQLTWFGKIPEIHWFQPSEKDKIFKFIHQNS
ncbi:MAG: tRNA (adenosine(37)-N6)-dimethylallyltransferase MiaA [Bacteroidales bacterium]